MSSIRTIGLLCLSAAGAAPGAFAQEWVVTPRAWVFFDGVVRPQGSDERLTEGYSAAPEGTATEAEPFQVTMLGGSLTRLLSAGTSSVTITAVTGSGSEGVKRVQYDTTVGPLTVIDTSWLVDFDRTDVELTYQASLTRSQNLGFVGGIRYERFFGEGEHVRRARSEDGTATYTVADDGVLEYDAYSVRAGISATSENIGPVRFYSNLQFFAGRREQTEAHSNTRDINPATGISSPLSNLDGGFKREITYIGPDASVGFLLGLGPTFELDVRYRTLIYYDIESDREGDGPDNPRTTHGLNIGLAARF